MDEKTKSLKGLYVAIIILMVIIIALLLVIIVLLVKTNKQEIENIETTTTEEITSTTTTTSTPTTTIITTTQAAIKSIPFTITAKSVKTSTLDKMDKITSKETFENASFTAEVTYSNKVLTIKHYDLDGEDSNKAYVETVKNVNLVKYVQEADCQSFLKLYIFADDGLYYYHANSYGEYEHNYEFGKITDTKYTDIYMHLVSSTCGYGYTFYLKDSNSKYYVLTEK